MIMQRLKYACLIVAVMVIAGCGDNSSSTQTGTVSKGPVNGAKARFFTAAGVFANYSARSNASGTIPYTGGRVTTTGGVYTDMNGAVRSAPPLETPAGMRNVTPFTTLYANASPADRINLQNLIGTLSIDTAVTGTISSTNALMAKLNESIGELLTQISEQGGTPSGTYLADVATAVGNLNPTTAAVSATLVTALTSVTAPTGVAINSTALTAIANTTIAGATVPTAAPATTATPTTASTGSGSGTGGGGSSQFQN